jgi:hypothetical protein
VTALRRALPGDLAALYRLRVPSTGGLRCSVIARGEAGRLSISEHFGSALSLAAWSTDGSTQVFDLREGCRLPSADVSSILGLSSLPMAAAVRLLGGRLPALDGDSVEWSESGLLMVHGRRWSCSIRLAPSPPWRVVEARELGAPPEIAWHLSLSDHTSSLPGHLRLEQGPERWAELDLVRLQWSPAQTLPELPELPLCETVSTEGGSR